MARDFFIGVDGGGTQTKVMIEDSQGHLIGKAVSGPANIGLSVSGAWESVWSALEEILCANALSLTDDNNRFHAGLGLAGSEVKEAADAFLEHPHPFATLALMSDAHAACIGAHKGSDGAIIIAGTGVIGYQIEGQHIHRVSGWGFPYDDEGSGAWLGLEAVRLTLQWRDARSEKSALAEDVFAFFNHDISYLIHWAKEANSTEFARLAPLVINHAQQEESVAVRLLKKAAHAIEKVAHGLIKQRGKEKEPLPCSFVGGIAPFIEPFLEEHLCHSLVPRQGDALSGAILSIRQNHHA